MLNEIILISFAAFCTGAFSNFIEFCFEPGKILSWYYNWLVKKFTTQVDEKTIKVNNALFNPLGGCMRCYNWWLGVIPAVYVLTEIEPALFKGFILFIAFQSLSFYFLIIIEKQTS